MRAQSGFHQIFYDDGRATGISSQLFMMTIIKNLVPEIITKTCFAAETAKLHLLSRSATRQPYCCAIAKSLPDMASQQQHWWLAQEVPEFSSQLQRQLEFNRFARDSSAPIFLRRTLRHAPRAPSLPATAAASAAMRCGGGLQQGTAIISLNSCALYNPPIS